MARRSPRRDPAGISGCHRAPDRAWALGWTNLAIDITAEEVPILDGSAASSCSCWQSAASSCRTTPKRFLRVLKTVEIREGEGATLKWARLSAVHGYKLSFEIDFTTPAVDATGRSVEFEFKQPVQARHRPRTHLRLQQGRRDELFERDWAGRQHGHVIVIDDNRVLNSEGLRYDDEFVKHKILGLDRRPAYRGQACLPRTHAYKSGHARKNRGCLTCKLLADPGYEVVPSTRSRRATGFAEWPPAGKTPAPMMVFSSFSACCLWRGCCVLRLPRHQPGVAPERALVIVRDRDRRSGLLCGADPRTVAVML